MLLLDEPTRGIDVGSKARDLRARSTSWLAKRAASKAVIMVVELPARAARRLRPHRGHVPRPLGPARPVAEIDEQALLREAALGSEAA